MKLEELEKVVREMTEGPWHAKNDNALNQWLVYPAKERLLHWSDGKIVGPDEPRLYPIEDKEWNAKGIAALRNHAELFLELAKECSGIEHYDYCCGEKCVCRIGKIEKVLEELEGLGE